MQVKIFLFFYVYVVFNEFFIRRQRNYKPNTSPYEVDFHSMKKIKTGHIQFELINIEQSEAKFQLDIYTLEQNSVRVQINEINPIRKRFQVEHSLVGEPKLVE